MFAVVMNVNLNHLNISLFYIVKDGTVYNLFD